MTLRPANILRRLRSRRAALLALALLLAWPPLAWLAARALVVSEELPQADAIVVLAGSSAYVERTRRAAALFTEGRAPKVLLTNDGQQGGWSNELERNPLFVERAAWELESAGVPRDRVEMLPETVSSTHDEALLLRGYAQAHGLRSLLIVTSDYHSRRALWTFRKVFEESGVRVGLMNVGEGSPSPATWWLHARGWNVVAGEYFKLIYYRLHYN